MRETIFSNSNFVFFMYSGTGVNDTLFESLRVASIGDADKHVVEVRLNSDMLVFTGEPVHYKYKDAFVSYGLSSRQYTLEDTKNLINILQDAVEFAERINSWLSENPEWSVER